MSNENRVSEVRTTQSEPEREQRIFSFKATQWIWLLLGILEAVIALRIGLKLIGANPESLIVALICLALSGSGRVTISGAATTSVFAGTSRPWGCLPNLCVRAAASGCFFIHSR